MVHQTARSVWCWKSFFLSAACFLVPQLPSIAALNISVNPLPLTSDDLFSLRATHLFGDPGQERLDQSITVSGYNIDVYVLMHDLHGSGVWPEVITPDGAYLRGLGPLSPGTYQVDAQMWMKRRVGFGPEQTTLFDTGSFTFDVAPPASPDLPGDYNHDGVVDAADYTVWRDSVGQTGVGLAADGDGSHAIDTGDYTVWASNFGTTSPGSGAGRSDTVPEPASWTLFAACVVSICVRGVRGYASR
jgi:hypothetical protein